MDSTVELLQIGRERVAHGWNRGSLIDRWQEEETFSFVTTVCALGGLVPEEVYRAKEESANCDPAESWITNACQNAVHCKAVYFLAEAIRALPGGEERYQSKKRRTESMREVAGSVALPRPLLLVSIHHDVITSWNDEGTRRQEDVLAVYDAAIRMAEEVAAPVEVKVAEKDLVTAGD